MLVVSFAVEGTGNCVEVGDVPYVYARTAKGSFVMPAQCSHRGGPLHLATVEGPSGRAVCPWHGRATSTTRFLKKGIPAVRHGNTVTAVFPVAADTKTSTSHRPMSADLCGLRAAV